MPDADDVDPRAILTVLMAALCFAAGKDAETAFARADVFVAEAESRYPALFKADAGG